MITHPGIKVSKTSNAPLPSNRHRRNQPVPLPSQRAELLRRKRSSCPRDLRDTPAGELDPDNVGVLSQDIDGVGADIDPRRHPGVIVDDNGDGTGVRDLGVEVDDGLLIVHREVEEARHQDQGEVRTSLLRLDGQVDDVPRAGRGAAQRERDVWPVEFPGDLAGAADEFAFLGHGEGDGFSVGAGEDDCCNSLVQLLFLSVL